MPKDNSEEGLIMELVCDCNEVNCPRRKALKEYLDQQKEEIKKKLLEEGHGGGNWRRLVLSL